MNDIVNIFLKCLIAQKILPSLDYTVMWQAEKHVSNAS